MFADTKALTLAGLEKEEGRIGGVMGWAGWWGKIANSASATRLAAVHLEYNRAKVHSHKCPEMDLAKNN